MYLIVLLNLVFALMATNSFADKEIINIVDGKVEITQPKKVITPEAYLSDRKPKLEDAKLHLIQLQQAKSVNEALILKEQEEISNAQTDIDTVESAASNQTEPIVP